MRKISHSIFLYKNICYKCVRQHTKTKKLLLQTLMTINLFVVTSIIMLFFVQENMNILKQLFKKMDPSILKTSTFSDHGDVQLSFKYDPTRELLLVKVICCRDLEPKDLRGKSADPYVKVTYAIFGCF